MLALKKNILTGFLFLCLCLAGLPGCGGDGGGGTSSAVTGETDDTVDANQTKGDALLTGEGIIDPIELSGGQAGTETSNVTHFRFSTHFRTLNTPTVLESLVVEKGDLFNNVPLNLFSKTETYTAEVAAKRVAAHLEKQAIYTGFRAIAAMGIVTISAPPNLPYKYVRKRLKWKFLVGDSRSETSKNTTFNGFSPGTASHYSKTIVTLHADLPANAEDHEITIDGITIDLGTKALTREEIAQKIVNTDFSSGDNYQSMGIYYVGVSGYNLLFQRRGSDANLDGAITIQDNSYTGTIAGE